MGDMEEHELRMLAFENLCQKAEDMELNVTALKVPEPVEFVEPAHEPLDEDGFYIVPF